ncbi:hypothetical protein NP493_1339g00016 [Ridgeia piscesae]|uniref:Uncharacterized protein n=1 Tax=Ridgeia piscesae TaxID=27915 RepID=A0AAD9NF82_RIDPI|nr:hypothetical protein NP493_1339g00016 [Ridgeia piscesae]
MDVAKVPGCGSLALNAAHDMLVPAVAKADLETNGDVNGTEPRQHTTVAITTVSPITEVAGHTARKSHRRGKTCIITLSPYNRELEQKKTSNKSAYDEPRPNTSGQAGSRLKPIRHISTKSTSEDATPCLYCLYCCELFQTVKVARSG